MSLFKIRAKLSWERKKIKLLDVQKYAAFAFSLVKQVWDEFVLFIHNSKENLLYFSVLFKCLRFDFSVNDTVMAGRFVYLYSIQQF